MTKLKNCKITIHKILYDPSDCLQKILLPPLQVETQYEPKAQLEDRLEVRLEDLHLKLPSEVQLEDLPLELPWTHSLQRHILEPRAEVFRFWKILFNSEVSIWLKTSSPWNKKHPKNYFVRNLLCFLNIIISRSILYNKNRSAIYK